MTRIPCEACEGTGDWFRHDPQPDDPSLHTRIYGRPCPVCDGDGELPAFDEGDDDE